MLLYSVNIFYIFSPSICPTEDFFAFILYYNSYDDLIEKNLLESLFDIVLVIIFKIIFLLEMHQNNIFYFLKFIFDIITLNNIIKI